MENVSSIDFVFHVVKAGVVAIGNDGLGLGLEFFEVVDDEAADEAGSAGDDDATHDV